MRPDLSVVIACLNEEEALPHLLSKLELLEERAASRGVSLEVVLVDDGSMDTTAEILSNSGHRVMSHGANRGFGAAMRTGFAAARGRVLVSYDADATYPVEDILTLFEKTTEAEVAGATPFAAGGEVDADPLRVFLSRTVAGLYALALRERGRGVTVHTCAFRAYRRDVVFGVLNRADDFLAAAELLARLLIRGARVVEVPSRLTAREYGRSKMRIVSTAFRHLGQIIAIALRRPPFAAPMSPRRRRGNRLRTARLRAWNESLNRDHPMRSIEEHETGIIRDIEARRRQEILARLDLRPGQPVLDLGAEEGAYADRFRVFGARCIAVDIDAAVLARGRRRHALPSVVADVHALPFRDGAVRKVLLAEVLEHCPDPATVLFEALRVAGPDGRVALTVPDDERVLFLKRGLRAAGLQRLLAGLPEGLAPGHLHVFSRDVLTGLLTAAGRVLAFTRDIRALAFLAVIAPRREDPR